MNLAMTSQIRHNAEMTAAALKVAAEWLFARVRVDVGLEGGGPGEALAADLAGVLLGRLEGRFAGEGSHELGLGEVHDGLVGHHAVVVVLGRLLGVLGVLLVRGQREMGRRGARHVSSSGSGGSSVLVVVKRLGGGNARELGSVHHVVVVLGRHAAVLLGSHEVLELGVLVAGAGERHGPVGHHVHAIGRHDGQRQVALVCLVQGVNGGFPVSHLGLLGLSTSFHRGLLVRLLLLLLLLLSGRRR